MPSTLVNMQSKAFACIQLTDNAGQYSLEEVIAQYEQAILDLPRPLVSRATTGRFSWVNPPLVSALPARPVMRHTSRGLVGGPRVCAFLNDQMSHLKALISEIDHIQALLHEALGGFDTEELDLFALIGLNLSDHSQELNPLSAYFIRALVRMRMSQVDYELVKSNIEAVLGMLAHVNRGLLDPAVHMSPNDKAELEEQLRAWESVLCEIELEWFKLCTGLSPRNIFYRDLQRRKQFKQWQNGYNI